MSGDEYLICKKNSAKIRLGKKVSNNGGKVFIFTIKFYKSPRDAAVLCPEMCNLEQNTDREPKGTAINKQ